MTYFIPLPTPPSLGSIMTPVCKCRLSSFQTPKWAGLTASSISVALSFHSYLRCHPASFSLLPKGDFSKQLLAQCHAYFKLSRYLDLFLFLESILWPRPSVVRTGHTHLPHPSPETLRSRRTTVRVRRRLSRIAQTTWCGLARSQSSSLWPPSATVGGGGAGGCGYSGIGGLVLSNTLALF